MKSYTLTQMKDRYIGKLGTAERDKYEYKLKIEVQGKASSRKIQLAQLITTPPNHTIKP